MNDNLNNRINNLEEKFEYQDQTIDTLNDVIIDQQSQITRLTEQINRIESVLLNIKDDQGQDPPPPHY